MAYIVTLNLFLVILLLLAGCAAPPGRDTSIRPSSGEAPVTARESVSESSREHGGPERRSAESGDLWPLLRANLRLDHETNRRNVQSRMRWYASKKGYLQRSTERGQPYLYHIFRELEKRDMPAELALLPIVESAFQPYAESPMRAVGLWQFIPETGRRYGLRKNWWKEGRRDVVAATRAALDYLQHLNDMFDGDWLLSMAAYNAGEVRVSKAIKKNQRNNKGTDFWSLRLPNETRGYVTSLLAVSALVKDPEPFNVQLAPVEARPYFVPIELDQPLDLALAAKLANMDVDALRTLNPAIRRWLIPANTRLLLPVDRQQLFGEALDQTPERVRWIKHRLQKKESLPQLAARHLLDANTLAQLNGLDKPHARTGQELRIPKMMYPERDYHSKRYRRGFEKSKPSKIGSPNKHIVRKGESFWSIARRYGTSINKLRLWNPGIPSKALRLGQKLNLWVKTTGTGNVSRKASQRESQGKITRYQVTKGDTLWDIAQREETSVQRIAALNGISSTRPIRVGQKLKLPGASQPRAGTRATKQARKQDHRKIDYVVRKGDSLWSIAQHFNTSISKLLNWNRINKRNHLKPGQKLTILVSSG